MTSKILTIYDLEQGSNKCRIEPASKNRDWMEDSGAVRCLPVVIANQHGWAIYPNSIVYAKWDGGKSKESLLCRSSTGLATSHFGHGILTFHTQYLFRLSEGYSLYISGPPNTPKKGIYPLTGIYEADWAPYSFTMNWMFTEVDYTVTFTPDEPFCFIFPIERSLIESFEVDRRPIESNMELKLQHDNWSESRRLFNEIHKGEDTWQKHYFQGTYFDGTKCPFDHKTKLYLKK